MSIPLTEGRHPGEYPLEALPEGWANAEVALRQRKRIEILDIRAGENQRVHYPQEPMAEIAFKCALLLPGLFIYFLGYTAVHLIRLPIVTFVNCSPTAFVKQIWTLVRIPFYFIALEFAALYGIFKPLAGRAWFADLESRLHDGKSRRESVQYEKKNDQRFLEMCWEALSLEEDPNTMFAGFCMQPYGKADDKHIRNRAFRIVQIPQAV